jgi:hypothetical protein
MFQYPGNDVFPATVGLPDDGDPPDAAEFNIGYEGLLDRTQYLKTRLAADPALNSPSMLTSIASPANQTTRMVVGYGLYTYNSGATDYADGIWIVNGNGGVGRWGHIEFNAPFMRLISRGNSQITDAVKPLYTSHGSTGALDYPLGRSTGALSNLASVTLAKGLNGDWLHIEYNLQFKVQLNDNTDGGTEKFSDAAFDVQIVRAAGNIHPNPCKWPYVEYGTDNPKLPSGWLISSAGVANYIPIAISAWYQLGIDLPASTAVVLVGAVKDNTLGVVLQGSQLTVSQYRVVVP